jgi:signal transduction histidine kinase
MAIQLVRSKGDRPRFVAVVRDVTERQRIEAERSRLLAESQAAVRMRDQFLSVASHELKTPVTALQLHIDHLLRSTREQRDLGHERLESSLAAVDRQVERLTRLIDNLLDVSRVTETRLDLVVEDVNLREIVESAVERLQPEAKRAHCAIDVAGETAVRGVWDGGRLDQVVMQLLGNAVKYGAGKPIEVRVDLIEGQALLTIRDQGIGIAEGDHARIFQRFERASSERQYGGLGLGLWIVQQIVAAHGGEIRVRSAPGEGATFEVVLPSKPAKSVPTRGDRTSMTVAAGTTASEGTQAAE